MPFGAIQQFDYTPGSNCGTQWTNWLRSFRVFMEAASTEQADRNWCALLLHFAGPKVQQVYASLEGAAAQTEPEQKTPGPWAGGLIAHEEPLEKMVKTLTAFFAPKRNRTYERHIFRNLKQLADEKIDMFTLRLRDQAEKCEFEERTDEFIKHQITSGCASVELRKKILSRAECTLDDLLHIARTIESVQEEDKAFRAVVSSDTAAAEVNKIEMNRQPQRRGKFQSQFQFACNRCGRKGHRGADPHCPAKGRTCNKCGGRDHFARNVSQKANATNEMEMSRQKNDSKIFPPSRRKYNWSTTKPKPAKESLLSNRTSFALLQTMKQIPSTVSLVVSMQRPLSTQARNATWSMRIRGKLGRRPVSRLLRKKESDRTFKAYGGQTLAVLGMFTAIIRTGDKNPSQVLCHSR